MSSSTSTSKNGNDVYADLETVKKPSNEPSLLSKMRKEVDERARKLAQVLAKRPVPNYYSRNSSKYLQLGSDGNGNEMTEKQKLLADIQEKDRKLRHFMKKAGIAPLQNFKSLQKSAIPNKLPSSSGSSTHQPAATGTATGKPSTSHAVDRNLQRMNSSPRYGLESVPISAPYTKSRLKIAVDLKQVQHTSSSSSSGGRNGAMSAFPPSSSSSTKNSQDLFHQKVTSINAPPGFDKRSFNPAEIPFDPLQNKWRIFYDRRGLTGRSSSHGANYENNLIPLGQFDNIADFWRYFSNLKNASELELASNLHIFKEGIKPMWEDPANINGAKWTITIPIGHLITDAAWTNCVLSVIGETLDDDGNEICGAVFSRRSRGNRIAVWFKSCDKPDVHLSIGTRLVKFLKLENEDVSMDFQAHKDSLKTGSSYSSSSLNRSHGKLTLDRIKEQIKKEES